MKLMFNKTTLEGHWFKDGENTDGYTELAPPHAGAVFDEDASEWVVKAEETAEESGG